jgi:hypothetical protein
MRSVSGLLAIALLLSAVACSGSPQGACRISDNGGGGDDAGGITQCIDYSSGYGTGSAMSDCTYNQGMYVSLTCPTANRVGRCVMSDTSTGTTLASTVSYYPPTTANDAAGDCSDRNSADVSATYVAN